MGGAVPWSMDETPVKLIQQALSFEGESGYGVAKRIGKSIYYMWQNLIVYNERVLLLTLLIGHCGYTYNFIIKPLRELVSHHSPSQIY
jgi:hypothetical protein